MFIVKAKKILSSFASGFTRWELALIIALTVTLAVSAAQAGTAGTSQGLEDKLIRLHVVGASNSDEDQALKLRVRDEALRLLEGKLAGITDMQSAHAIINNEIPSLIEGLNSFLSLEGSNCSVDISLQKEAFPTREYETFSLPAGPYTALRIVIGPGAGKNWWCVVFPPLCAATAIEQYPAIEAGLTEEDIALITQENESYVIRFKVLEWIGEIKNLFVK